MEEQNTSVHSKPRLAATAKIDALGWAVFFLITGFLLLFPEDSLPDGVWLISVGISAIVIQILRQMYGIGSIGFFIGVGVIMLALGLGDLLGVELPVFPIVFLLIGTSIVFDLLFKKK